MLSKEEIQEILKIEGKTRGDESNNSYICIGQMEGEEALEKIKKTMKELGAFEDYSDKKEKWVDTSKDILLIAVTADLLDWSDERIKNFGKNMVKISFSEKIFIKYFVSIEKVVKSVSGHWKRFFSTGEMVVIELNKEKKYAIIRLVNFKAHPSYYKMLAGYFEAVVELAVAPGSIVEDSECPNKKKDCHQYLFKW